jgi:uracil phosphoribosyltransferase
LVVLTLEPVVAAVAGVGLETCRFGVMRVHVANHPLITHKITVLRDKNTPSPTFRLLVEELVTLLAYEATRDVKVQEVEVETPLTKTKGVHLSNPQPIIVPVLRAGLGMLEGMMKLLPTAEVGFLGIKRNEETLEPFTYAERLPDDLTGRQVFIIDPMLATGGTLIDSINYVFERGATDVTAVCLLGAPEGLKAVEAAVGNKNVTVVLGALDEKLNEIGYIVPGLGDAGDRLYGLAE